LLFYKSIIDKFKSRFVYHHNRNIQRDPSDVILDDYPFRNGYVSIERRSSMLGGEIYEEVLKKTSL
jgi:hypothetical protein